MSSELVSQHEPDAVQALKCLLDLGHDWRDFATNQKRCEYCGKVVRDA